MHKHITLTKNILTQTFKHTNSQNTCRQTYYRTKHTSLITHKTQTYKHNINKPYKHKTTLLQDKLNEHFRKD